MEEELIGIKNSAFSLILEAKDKEEVEQIRIQFLGRNGKLTALLKKISKLPIEKRPEIGTLANEIKINLDDAIENKNDTLKQDTETARKQRIDITNPGVLPQLGHLHLITQAIEEITRIFEK
ncbi:phenylalanine--tRNA ligase subunit alpha, partial [Patescibacteria group bacterium]|nr:phenylalanine--tRNA ligase subunit alpha [Patescibacteria group bacterium]